MWNAFRIRKVKGEEDVLQRDASDWTILSLLDIGNTWWGLSYISVLRRSNLEITIRQIDHILTVSRMWKRTINIQQIVNPPLSYIWTSLIHLRGKTHSFVHANWNDGAPILKRNSHCWNSVETTPPKAHDYHNRITNYHDQSTQITFYCMNPFTRTKVRLKKQLLFFSFFNISLKMAIILNSTTLILTFHKNFP